MANTGAPNTGGSQFFMNVSDNEALDWFSDGPDHHVVFGQITSGYDVCLAISKVPTVDERPKHPVRMRSAVVSNLPG